MVGTETFLAIFALNVMLLIIATVHYLYEAAQQ